MKDFENYQKTSKDYDSLRRAYGVDLVLAKIAEKGKKNLSILDIGCGTGNYLVSIRDACQNNPIYHNLITKFYGVEPNAGMLQEARDKLLSTASLFQGPAQSLPKEIPNHSIDIILCTQVLHHLVDEKRKTKYREVKKAFREMKRVLSPDGIICIDNVFPNQVKSYWFKHLIPQAMKILRRKMVPFQVFQSFFLTDSPQAHIQRLVSLDELLYDKKEYFDPKGPLKQSWRNTDSTWSLANPQEFKNAMAFVKKQNENQTMMRWIQSKDRIRQQIGLSTFIFIQ